MKFEPERSWEKLDARIAEEKDLRCKQLLEQVRDHLLHEIGGDLPKLMDTLVDEPAYHIYGAPVDMGPKGRANVESFYAQMIENGGHRFQLDLVRIVVDHDTVVTEADMFTQVGGAALIAAGHESVEGEPIEPEGRYLGVSRLVTVWPADTDGRLFGEDIYLGSPPLSRIIARTG